MVSDSGRAGRMTRRFESLFVLHITSIIVGYVSVTIPIFFAGNSDDLAPDSDVGTIDNIRIPWIGNAHKFF